MIIGTDIGGTFTDFVIHDKGRLGFFKVLSTTGSPANGVADGLSRISPSRLKGGEFYHGTTAATNAVLERKGSKTALITTKGFRDVIEIGRQKRSELYELKVHKPEPLVPRRLRFEVPERIDFNGKIIEPLKMQALRQVISRIKSSGASSVAVCLLFSYMNPKHELAVEKELHKAGFEYVSISSRVHPEFREYERTTTTIFDAYIKPLVQGYMSSLSKILKANQIKGFYVMQSNGGIVDSSTAVKRPVATILSGPAGGIAASRFISDASGDGNLITFDMGGTSIDICAVTEGIPGWTSSSTINDLPIQLPVLDIVTIGAGGGSIAKIDSGGALTVGPQSAGSTPGPICYGFGGQDVTVTDADLSLGIIDSDHFLGGKMKLDSKSARDAISLLGKPYGLSAEDTALGVCRVVEANMARGIRRVTLEKGLDLRDYSLLAYGGAGPMHACSIARDLGIPNVRIPFAPGVFSAFGILISDIKLDMGRTLICNVSSDYGAIKDELSRMIKDAQRQLGKYSLRRTQFIPSVDMRYRGQNLQLNVPFKASAKKILEGFHKRHRELYGFSVPDEDVEVVTIRLSAVGIRSHLKLPKVKSGSMRQLTNRRIRFRDGYENTPVYEKSQLKINKPIEGPLIFIDQTSTCVATPGSRLLMDEHGNISIEVGK